MERLITDTTDILEAARFYTERGKPIIPLDGKVPPICGWQEFVANEANVLFHFGPESCGNIGLRTGRDSGYLVIDTDSPQAEAWVREHCPKSPMQVLTGSGSKHHYYACPPRAEIRNRQGLHKIKGLDVRGDGGYIVLPPSIHPETGQPYRWLTDFLDPDQLPRFSPAWVYKRTRRRIQTVVQADSDTMRLMEVRASRWLQLADGAVSGQGGHNRTFYVACRLTHDPPKGFGLGFDAALRLMLVWNEKCQPPWDEKALIHKIEDAIKIRDGQARSRKQ